MKRTLQVILPLAALLLAAPAFAQLTVPEIAYDSAPDFLNTGDIYDWTATGLDIRFASSKAREMRSTSASHSIR